MLIEIKVQIFFFPEISSTIFHFKLLCNLHAIHTFKEKGSYLVYDEQK